MSNNSYYNDQWRIINEPNQNKVSNYSMDFDGTSDFIDFGNGSDLSITGDLTLSAWVYLHTAPSPFHSIFSKMSSTTRNYTLYVRSNRTVSITTQVSGGTVEFTTSSTAVPLNTWTHVVVTFDSGVTNGTKYYFNGILDAVTGTHNVVADTSNLNIGRRTTGSQYFDGKIDQASIFDYALPATGTNSVATLYGGGTAVTNPMSLSPKPIAYYQLGDQSVDNGANLLVPNNSLSGYVFRSVPAQTTSIIPPNTITSDINYTGTPASPSGFTVSLWIKGIGPFGSGQTQLIFDHNSSTHTSATSQGVFCFASGSILFLFGSGTYRYYSIPSGIDFDEWNNIVVYFQPGNRSAGKVWINGGTPLSLSTGGGSSYNDFTAGFRLYLNSFNSNVMYFKDYEIDNDGATLLYNNGAPLLNTSTLAQAPDHWWKLNDDDTFNSGTSTWTINDYVGSENGTSANMTSNNLVISDLDNTGSSVGYSPYALDFGGITASLKTNTIPAKINVVTLSAWVKRTGTSGTTAGVFGVRNSGGSAPGYGLCWDLCFFGTTNKIELRIGESDNTAYIQVSSNIALADNTWFHVVGVADGTNAYLYINGVRQTDVEPYNGDLRAPTTNIQFAAQATGGSQPFNGQLSNCARWNVGLTQAEVTEIYNQGVPSNLNTFSGTAPLGWWQLGSNSSFESNAWTCLDEIGTDNAFSFGAMSNDDIVNGVGYSANGLGTSSIDIVGDAPYSTANGLSENMDVLDRTTDVPS